MLMGQVSSSSRVQLRLLIDHLLLDRRGMRACLAADWSYLYGDFGREDTCSLACTLPNPNPSDSVFSLSSQSSLPNGHG